MTRPRRFTESARAAMLERRAIAVAAMQGLIARGGHGWSGIAEDAYACADAMLEFEANEKKTEEP